MEMFQKAILPRIEELFEKKIQKLDSKFERKLDKYHKEVVGFKVEVMDEIKDLREEVIITLHQYKRTDRRLEKVEKRLNIPSSI